MFAGAGRDDHESEYGSVASNMNSLNQPSPNGTLNARPVSTARTTRYSLTDEGPVTKEVAKPPSRQSSTISKSSLATMKSNESMGAPAVPYLSAFGDIRENRASLVSLQEAEFGWSSHASGIGQSSHLQKKLRAQQPERSQSVGAANTTTSYRPVFAPAVAVEDLDSGAVGATNTQTTPKAKLDRGRSLKDRILGRKDLSPTIASRSLSTSPRQRFDPDATVVDDDGDMKKAFFTSEVYSVDSRGSSNSPRDEGLVGLARRISRKTIKRVQRSPETPPTPIPTQEELDKIPLYAAPAEANVPNAPCLSSYPPRAPLRPRALTDGAVTLRPTPSITVGAARLAYQKSLRQSNRTFNKAVAAGGGENARPRKISEASGANEDHLSMATPSRASFVGEKKRDRKSRAPEGWTTAEEILSNPSGNPSVKPSDASS